MKKSRKGKRRNMSIGVKTREWWRQAKGSQKRMRTENFAANVNWQPNSGGGTPLKQAGLAVPETKGFEKIQGHDLAVREAHPEIFKQKKD
jgi:hypothetical protein